jgi:hypothetical protein
VLEPTQVRVELVARNEPGSDPAGNRLKFAVPDQCADVGFGAAELGGNLADRQGCGPLHGWSMAFVPEPGSVFEPGSRVSTIVALPRKR